MAKSKSNSDGEADFSRFEVDLYRLAARGVLQPDKVALHGPKIDAISIAAALSASMVG